MKNKKILKKCVLKKIRKYSEGIQEQRLLELPKILKINIGESILNNKGKIQDKSFHGLTICGGITITNDLYNKIYR